MNRKYLIRINELDVADALAPRCQPSPSQENLQEQNFWARGYFVSTVGLDEATVLEYMNISGTKKPKKNATNS